MRISRAAAVDPSHGKLFVVSKDLPCLLKLELSTQNEAADGQSPPGRLPRSGEGRFMTPDVNCVTAPSWQGSLPLCHPSSASNQDSAPMTCERLSHMDVARCPRSPLSPIRRWTRWWRMCCTQKKRRICCRSERQFRCLRPRPLFPQRNCAIEAASVSCSLSRGLPVIAPPWTTLTAYDLNEGTIEWQVPLGEIPELAAKGFKDTGAHFPKDWPRADRGWCDFHGHSRPQGSSLGFGNGQSLVGGGGGCCGRGNACGISDRRT